ENVTEVCAGDEVDAIGSIKVEEYMSILLDFEKIIVEIRPFTGVHVDKLGVLGHRERSQKRLVVAEDSPMLRRLLKETLEEAGYERLTFFENGKEAWDYLG